MRLSKQQRNVLIGTILGDACLEVNGRNVRLRIDHSQKQKDYVMWKYRTLRNFAASKPRLIKVYDRRTNRTYLYWRFDTQSREEFVAYRQIFYKNGRKTIPCNIKQLLQSRLSLAVWYMDDGYGRCDCNGLHINTQAHPLVEQELLQTCLKDNFDLDSTIHKQSGKFKLYIPSKEKAKFCKIVTPFVIPGMRYKLLDPLTTES